MTFKQFLRLYRIAAPKWQVQVLLLVIGLLADGVKVILAIGYNHMLQNIQNTSLLVLGIFSFLTIIICGLLAYLQTKLMAQVEQQQQKKFQDQLLETQNDRDYALIESQKSGEWLILVQEDVEAVSSLVTTVILPLIKGAILFLVATIVGAYFSMILIGVILLCTFLSYYLPKLFAKKINDAYKNKMSQKENIQSKLISILDAVHLIKSYQYEDKMVMDFEKSYDVSAKYEVEAVKQKSALIATSIGSGFTISTLWLIVGGLLIANQSLTVGAFTAFMMLSDYFNWPFFFSTRNSQSAFGINTSYERIKTYCAQTDPEIGLRQVSAPIHQENSQVILDDVTFKYAEADKSIFNHFSLTLPKYQKIAIIGESGSGKSTLAKLIMGLYLPDKGRVQLLEGDKAFEGKAIFEHIAYVPQTTVLFNGTIFENMTLGRQDVTRDEVERVARLACAHDFIQNLEDGYETVVGAGSDKKLSGGQIQRIAIARALLKNASVYIFDEFSSAIDATNEKKLLANLRTIPKTMIFIAHKKEVIEMCELVYDVCDRGV